VLCFSRRRRHTRLVSDWSSDVCSSDLHLYELGRTATIREAETKQIELLDVRDIPVVRKYVADPANHGKQVTVAVEFDNSEKHAEIGRASCRERGESWEGEGG